MVDRVVAHIRKQGYFIVDKEPDTETMAAHPRIAKVTTRAAAVSGAWRTDPDDPQARVRHRSRCARDTATRSCASGRSAAAFQLGRSSTRSSVPTVGISLANYDDNQHTDNENLRLGNMWNGIVTLATLMTK